MVSLGLMRDIGRVDYVGASHLSLTGGTIWERKEHEQKNQQTPTMYKIEIEGKPYLDPVKKFAVSSDMVLAALVTN